MITYAKAGGPPDEWRQIKIFDGDVELKGVVEINTAEGWAVVIARDANGRVMPDWSGRRIKTARIESGKLRIERPTPHAAE